MISIRNLRKSFGRVEVLKGVNLDIAEKEVVVIIGPSGSGKSTLLRCINYLEEPTSGEITVDGMKLGETDINKVRAEVGMVFQRFNLFPHMTAMDNITLAPMKVRGVSREDFAEKRVPRVRLAKLEGVRKAYSAKRLVSLILAHYGMICVLYVHRGYVICKQHNFVCVQLAFILAAQCLRIYKACLYKPYYKSACAGKRVKYMHILV